MYPLLIAALLWGSRLSKKGEWNDSAFSLDQMKALQGFFAVCIMLHHIGQQTCAPWLDPSIITPGLELFVPFGFYMVGIFMFCSGYGLYVSYKTKPGYLEKSFILYRVLPIVFTGYVVTLIFFAARLLLGEKMGPKQAFWYLSLAKLCNPNGWYVLIIPIFYLAFFLAFRFCKKEKTAVLAVLAFTVVYQLIGTAIDHNDWWMRGEWWYNSVHFFVIGIFFARHEDKIVAHLKKHFVLYLVLSFVLMFLLYGVAEFTRGFASYYGENWGAPDKILRRRVTLCSEILASSAFVFFVFISCLKLKIGNRFLKFMGGITLEFYLIHGLFIGLFGRSMDGLNGIYHIQNVFLHVLAVFALGTLSAAGLSRLRKAVFRKRKVSRTDG
ncbi:MAG: acyltransferase [Lachnospiraceae bacterium]|nr:acyltransferase [Lachnospiraceae bacterium]